MQLITLSWVTIAAISVFEIPNEFRVWKLGKRVVSGSDNRSLGCIEISFETCNLVKSWLLRNERTESAVFGDLDKSRRLEARITDSGEIPHELMR